MSSSVAGLERATARSSLLRDSYSAPQPCLCHQVYESGQLRAVPLDPDLSVVREVSHAQGFWNQV